MIQGAGYPNPKRLLFRERDYLRSHGWKPARPDTGVELADESPGDKLRVDVRDRAPGPEGRRPGLDARAPSVAIALDRAVFDRVPTMSVLLEVGSS